MSSIWPYLEGLGVGLGFWSWGWAINRRGEDSTDDCFRVALRCPLLFGCAALLLPSESVGSKPL